MATQKCGHTQRGISLTSLARVTRAGPIRYSRPGPQRLYDRSAASGRRSSANAKLPVPLQLWLGLRSWPETRVPGTASGPGPGHRGNIIESPARSSWFD